MSKPTVGSGANLGGGASATAAGAAADADGATAADALAPEGVVVPETEGGVATSAEGAGDEQAAPTRSNASAWVSG